MEMISAVLVSLLSLFLLWRLYKVFQSNPELLSKENVSKSFSHMGMVALMLIALVAMLVMLVR